MELLQNDTDGCSVNVKVIKELMEGASISCLQKRKYAGNEDFAYKHLNHDQLS
jgi:hypothetical protein